MQLPFDEEEERAREIEEARRQRNTPGILQGQDTMIGGGSPEPSGGLLEALKSLYGTQSMRARRPNIEEQLQAEAKGLMADEAARNGLPNQVRDPNKERAEKARIKAMMGSKGPAGAPPGQDNFATPTPTAEERAKVSGAMMMAPVERRPSTEMPEDNMVRVTPGSYYDDFQPKGRQAPLAQPGMDMGSSDSSSDSPQLSPGGDYDLGLSELGEQDVQGLSNPGPVPRDPNDPREKLRAYIESMQGPKGQQQMSARNMAMADMSRQTGRTNSDLGFMNLLMSSANKVGTIGGRQASSSDYDQFTKGQQAQNVNSDKTLEKLTLQKDKQQDERMKGMMALAKMKQDEEKYTSDQQIRAQQLSDLAGYRKDSLDVQRERNTLDSGYKADTLKALQGANDSKAGLTDAQIKLIEQRTKNLANPGEKPVSKVDQARIDKLTAETDAIKKGKGPGADKPVTAGAAELDMFRKRMESADKAHAALSATGFDSTGTKDALLDSVPFVGNALVSKNKQLAKQYEVEFVRANLRDESGATIGVEEAYEQAGAFFPRWGDSPEKIARKKKIRAELVNAMKDSYSAQTGDQAVDMGSPAVSMPQLSPLPPDKARVKDQDGKILIIPRSILKEALSEPGVMEVK